MTLFHTLSTPPLPPDIDLRCCDVRDLVRDARGATLVHADPPWGYHNAPGVANPEANGIYDTMTDAEIAALLDTAYECALPGARLACWATWPKLHEFVASGGAGRRWRYVSGGAWLKTPHVGVGYHWRGATEPVLLFAHDGATGPCRDFLQNGYASRSGEHSRKPVDWLRNMLRAWTDPGDLVLDLWAGLAPMAVACRMEGRRYVGAEIDPDRHGVGVVSVVRA